MRSCGKLLKSNGCNPEKSRAPRTRNPAAGGSASGVDAKNIGQEKRRETNRTDDLSQAPLIGVYDGRQRIGSVVQLSERKFAALDLDGVDLGRFGTLKAAARAVPGGAS